MVDARHQGAPGERVPRITREPGDIVDLSVRARDVGRFGRPNSLLEHIDDFVQQPSLQRRWIGTAPALQLTCEAQSMGGEAIAADLVRGLIRGVRLLFEGE